jgi:hypothetical protein
MIGFTGLTGLTGLAARSRPVGRWRATARWYFMDASVGLAVMITKILPFT